MRKEMIYNISRRRILSGFSIGALSFLLGSNSKFINNKISHITSKDIEISIFQSQKINDLDNNNEIPYTTLELSKYYIKKELSKLGKNINIDVNIIQDEPIDLTKITSKNGRDAYYDWEDYFINTIPAKYKSKHSNILLSDIGSNENENGVGLDTCFCDIKKPLSMTFNTNLNSKYNSSIITKIQAIEYYKSVFATIIHEIGHNIGFKHNMGYAWYDEKNNIIKTTPMLSYYVQRDKYNNTKNFFGDKIVDVDSYNVQIEQVPYLNPKLSPKHIKYKFFN